MRSEEKLLRQRLTQQIKAYKIDISQTTGDGSFLCPHCGAKISPDDKSEDTHAIYESKLKDDNLDEVIIHCKRCLSLIHLVGFLEIYKESKALNFGETAREEPLFYIDHF